MIRVEPRYVRLSAIVYSHSICRACGSAGAADRPACRVTTCLACGSPQCMSHGLGRGQCAICYVGILVGWSGSDRRCSYKRCGERAIATSGKRNVCARHAHQARAVGVYGREGRVSVAEYIADHLARREREWALLDHVADANPIAGTASAWLGHP